MKLDALIDEMRLTFSERRDRLDAARISLARGDRRPAFTAEEIAKRGRRLPPLAAVERGLAKLCARRDDAPAWVLEAFEEDGDVV